MLLQDIRELSEQDIRQVFIEAGEKAFRGAQVHEWLWKKSVRSFDDMTNLGKPTREWLASKFAIRPIRLREKQISKDRTIKCSFELHDGHLIEGVLIPSDDRMTACVSSQVGCSLTCAFCATGKMDRIRNLTAGEIYDQVVMIRALAMEYYKQPLTNIVFMGMGEPLLNYSNVLTAIHHITSEHGLHMASDRITVSTAGVAKMIRKLADDQVKFNLALSLHAASDVKRNQIMPINESNELETVISALEYFHERCKGKLTFEYIAFRNFNDQIEDARQLVALCKRIPVKVNIIEYNPIGDGAFTKADPEQTDRLVRYLEQHGVTATVRRSRGKDIDAACGQLANKGSGMKEE